MQVKLGGSYSHHDRRELLKLVQTLQFRSSNTMHAPISTLPGVENVALAPSQRHQRPRRAARRRRRTDIEDVLVRLHTHGAELVGELDQYEDSYRLCYVRGPESIIVALAEQLS